MTGRPSLDVAREGLGTEAAAIRGLLAQLDERFDHAVELLRACTGRVVCTGMGKSGLILKKIAATLASTGTPAFFLHPAEAVHGDLGMIVPGDVVLAASYSGTTEELLRLVETLKRSGIPLVAMTANASSPVARHADIHLSVAIDRAACPLGLAPTAPTTRTRTGWGRWAERPPRGGGRPRPPPRPPPPGGTPAHWRWWGRGGPPARTRPASTPPASSASGCSRSSSSCTPGTPFPRSS